MYIYGIQSDRMHSFHPKLSNIENHCFCYKRPQKSQKIAQKKRSLNRNFLNLFNRYGIFFIALGESSCPGGSEYVWQRGVESLQGRVTAARS